MLILKTLHLQKLFSARLGRTTHICCPFENLISYSFLRVPKRYNSKKFIPTTSLLIAASFSTLAGCWSNKDKSLEPEPVELRSDSAALSTEVPESELANLSKRLYQSSMYTVARDSLNSLKDRYPLGPYAMLAELKYADSFFYNGEYREAATQYEAFTKNHPESPESLYAKLQAARSHASSAKTDGRDRSPWERSLALYNDLVKSDSSLAKTAALERASVIVELQAYDRDIMAFYKKTQNQAAVVAREAAFKKRWESEYSIQATLDDRNLYATLGSNRPSIELAPSLRSTPIQKLVMPPIHDSSSPTSNSDAEILSISCSDTPVPYIIIELATLPEKAKALLGTDKLMRPQNGRVALANFSFSSGVTTWNCHAQTFALLDPEGQLSVPSQKDLLLSAIENPPRLVLSTQPE